MKMHFISYRNISRRMGDMWEVVIWRSIIVELSIRISALALSSKMIFDFMLS